MRERTQDNSLLRERLLEAIENGNAAATRSIVTEHHPADVAEVLVGLLPEDRLTIWAHTAVGDMGDILVELPEGVRDGLIQVMDDETLVRAVKTLDIDELADLIPGLDEKVIADVLFAVGKEGRSELDTVLSYDDDTAGGLMNVDTVVIRENITLAVVQRYLRLLGELPEYTDKLFVVDMAGRLRGILFLSTLLTEDSQSRVARVMDDDPIHFPANLEDREVAAAFERYNLISAPVTDSDNRLVGRITIDDVVDVIREEADRSLMAPAGLSEEDDIFGPVAAIARGRAIWLGVNLLTAFAASWVIARFEGSIEKLVALAVLMPIVASMGGNAGTQTLTVVIRGLGSGTITTANALEILKKETLVGGLNGLVWALVVAAIAILWYGNLELALIVGIALVINLLVSAVSGVLIPVACKRLGIDPALASGVALTTVTDIIGFLAILGLATLFLL